MAHLVKEHKGIIRTVKNPEGGMTFTIIFPACDEAFAPSEFRKTTPDIRPDNSVHATVGAETMTAEPEGEETPHDESATAGSTDEEETDEIRPKILIVDDNESLNAFISNMFCDKFTVLQAFDGQEGLRKATEECPDIIISDVLMPGDIDGFALCRRIKTDSSTSHIPVILLTAKILDEHKIEGYNPRRGRISLQAVQPRGTDCACQQSLCQAKPARPPSSSLPRD